MSQTYIAAKFGTTQDIVSGLLRQWGRIPEKRYGAVRGPKHGSWRGGTHILNGYRLVTLDRGSRFWSMASSVRGYVAEHRLVMAESLGRCLTANETVHHINGDRLDNRLENLQLRQGKHGKGMVSKCADCGSHNVVQARIADPPLTSC